jgi:hypothetical protein
MNDEAHEPLTLLFPVVLVPPAKMIDLLSALQLGCVPPPRHVVAAPSAVSGRNTR